MVHSVYGAIIACAVIAGRQVGVVVLTTATLASEQSLSVVFTSKVYGLPERCRRDAAVSCLHVLTDIDLLILSGAIQLCSCGQAVQHHDNGGNG